MARATVLISCEKPEALREYPHDCASLALCRDHARTVRPAKGTQVDKCRDWGIDCDLCE